MDLEIVCYGVTLSLLEDSFKFDCMNTNSMVAFQFVLNEYYYFFRMFIHLSSIYGKR